MYVNHLKGWENALKYDSMDTLRKGGGVWKHMTIDDIGGAKKYDIIREAIKSHNRLNLGNHPNLHRPPPTKVGKKSL